MDEMWWAEDGLPEDVSPYVLARSEKNIGGRKKLFVDYSKI